MTLRHDTIVRAGKKEHVDMTSKGDMFVFKHEAKLLGAPMITYFECNLKRWLGLS